MADVRFELSTTRLIGVHWQAAQAEVNKGKEITTAVSIANDSMLRLGHLTLG